MKARSLSAWGAVVAAGAAAVLALNTVFTVGQGQQAVVLRLGRPSAVINAPAGLATKGEGPGLYARIPLVDTVVRLDRRTQVLETGPQEVVLSDEDRLLVTPAMTYRIVDPLRVYRRIGAQGALNARLQGLLVLSLRQVLGGVTAHEVTAAGGGPLMAQVRDAVVGAVRAQRLGVEIADVRLVRADPPDAQAQFVYRRMTTAEAEQAAQIRASGEQRKRDVMAAADREAALLRAEANGQAAQIRGAGAAARAALFAKAYGQDQDFARFYDAMQAYRATLGKDNTVFVLSAGSGFLRDFARDPAAK